MRDTSDDWGDIYQAYKVYKELERLPSNNNSVIKFFRFIGVEAENWGRAELSHFHDDANKKIKWLNGPHASTMYKIWLAQNDPKDR